MALLFEQSLGKKAAIHQVTTILATSKMSYFQVALGQ